MGKARLTCIFRMLQIPAPLEYASTATPSVLVKHGVFTGQRLWESGAGVREYPSSVSYADSFPRGGKPINDVKRR